MQELHCRMDLAQKYGADIAIFLHNLVFWVEKNMANGKNCYDGRFWTYNTMDAFAELYPLWSRDQIKRMIAKCREKGLILVGEYNKDRRDRTKWYSPSDEILALYGVMDKWRTRQMQGEETPQSEGETATALPEGLPEGNPPSSPPKRGKGDKAGQDRVFEAFWQRYPRKVNKARARAVWDKLSPDPALCRVMAEALRRFLASPEWQRDGGADIPHPATWLRNRRWEDDDLWNGGPDLPHEEPEPPRYGWD